MLNQALQIVLKQTGKKKGTENLRKKIEIILKRMLWKL